MSHKRWSKTAAAAMAGIALVVLLPAAAANARPVSQDPAQDPDGAFERARQLAFSDARDEARAVAAQILEHYPQYHDARVLLGRLDAWDRRFDAARVHLDQVLEAVPEYVDARLARVDVEIWSGNLDAALADAEAGLRLDPESPELLHARARALWLLGRSDEAARAARRALEITPGFPAARQLLTRLETASIPRSGLVLEYDRIDFSEVFDHWSQVSVALATKSSVATVLLRVNRAQRFGESRTQFEVEAYPYLGRSVYAYLNYGYSEEGFFPRHRAGGELYLNLGDGYEASAGARWLDFETTEVTIYTGSVGKYIGDYWISLRPYVTPEAGDVSVSGWLSARRYFSSSDHYLGLSVGGGSSRPDIDSALDLGRQSSAGVDVEWRFPVASRTLLGLSAGYRSEEMTFGERISRFDLGGRLQYQF